MGYRDIHKYHVMPTYLFNIMLEWCSQNMHLVRYPTVIMLLMPDWKVSMFQYGIGGTATTMQPQSWTYSTLSWASALAMKHAYIDKPPPKSILPRYLHQTNWPSFESLSSKHSHDVGSLHPPSLHLPVQDLQLNIEGADICHKTTKHTFSGATTGRPSISSSLHVYAGSIGLANLHNRDYQQQSR
jgi:hypothetical protein